MATENTSLQMDLTYLPVEDRLLLSLRKNSEQAHWWLTRRLSTALVAALADKLEKVGLPSLPFQRKVPERDLSQEHALSLEFDGPQTKKAANAPAENVLLMHEVTLTVTELECTLILKSQTKHSQMSLTRKETHALLEMLASKARHAGWLEHTHWPVWLKSAP